MLVLTTPTLPTRLILLSIATETAAEMLVPLPTARVLTTLDTTQLAHTPQTLAISLIPALTVTEMVAEMLEPHNSAQAATTHLLHTPLALTALTC